MAKSLKHTQKVGTVAKITTAILLMATAALTWWHFVPPERPTGPQEFFTDDDGSTWFSDDRMKLAPFDHHGKTAVVAKVYQTAGGKQFVAYMMKLSDKARVETEYSQKNGQMRSGPTAAQGKTVTAILVKRPHEGDWVPANDPKGLEIQKVVCPNGSTDYTSVQPQ